MLSNPSFFDSFSVVFSMTAFAPFAAVVVDLIMLGVFLVATRET